MPFTTGTLAYYDDDQYDHTFVTGALANTRTVWLTFFYGERKGVSTNFSPYDPP